MDSNVFPAIKNKYYVYGLFKPGDFNPFYIGKGKNGRINDHFKPSALVKNTPKIGVIKKYGDSIRREILCFFDKESTAYEFEEYLIDLYKLRSEGGCLMNYAKTRFEYSDKFVEDVSSIGYKFRERKYDTNLIHQALSKFYLENKTSDVVSVETGIPENYLGYVLRGKKCKDDFNTFIENNKQIEKQIPSIRKTLTKYRVSKSRVMDTMPDDVDIIKYFNMVCDGTITVTEAAQNLQIKATSLGLIFSGKARTYLQLDYDKYINCNKGRYVISKMILSCVKDLLLKGTSVSDIVKQTGYGKTTVYRAKDKILKEQSMTTPHTPS